jgi:fructokinase
MFDIYGLGNALVDEVHQVEDSFLRRHKIAKGYMTLVEESRIDALIHDLQQSAPERMSGGSAANTAYAAQGFGARAFYSCKVTNDPTGTHFLGDLAAAGIATNRNAATGLGKSGRCLILVTPDAERTMNTFLGVSSELSEADIDEAALATSRYFYVEGYLSSSPSSLAAAIECRELAERRGVKTAVSLSDPSMIQFFRDNLGQILGNGVDHLFCNEEEALSWARTDRIDVAVAELKDISRSCNITLGARGSLCVSSTGATERVAGFEVHAIDTNGAGDIYAGACLAAWTRGAQPADAARFANFAAATLVQRYGARLPSVNDYSRLSERFDG